LITTKKVTRETREKKESKVDSVLEIYNSVEIVTIDRSSSLVRLAGSAS